MKSRWTDVRSADNKSFGAFVATPPTGSGPGILLIQEIFGVNEHIRAVAQQYALDGFTVLAPDLFWRSEPRVDLGYGEADFAKGFAIMQKTDFAKAVQDLGAAASALRALPECKGKIASLGYCMGGLLSYLAAASGAVDGAVCYYGGGIGDQLGVAEKVRVPILFHFAAKDGYIPLTAVEAVRKAFASHKSAAVHLYPDVDHGFNCWGRPMYNQKAATLAHARSLEFLAAL
jgi:carboxymethylenebutenolidase